ncbi:assembly of actin patch protein [Parahypoxylon ruwenzoriense]
MVDGESGPSNTARGGSSSAGSSSAQKDKRHGLKGKRRLMKNDENNDQGDDENQQPKRIKSNLENGGSNAARRTAQPREGINPATERLLRSRKELDGRTEEEKWERIYIILFPADNPMDLPSPYYESYIGADVAEGSPSTESTRRRYDEFFQSEFSQRIYKVLEQKVDEALDSAEKGLGDELKRQLPGICRDIQTELYKEFQASIEAERELDHSGPGENAAEIPNSELEATLPGAWLDSPYAPWSQFLLENQATAPSSLIAPFPGDFGNIPSLDTLPIPSGSDVIDHGLRAVSAVLFKVRAVFDYTSDHVDDLSFRAGQIVTVVDEQDANWYRGEYVDDFGARKEGMFPRNFVEKYVPIVPPRPART